jgi:sec-independent protein translocase protein TatA
VLIIALLVFGPGKLADIGKGLGDGIRNFKEGMKDNPNPTPKAATEAENKSTPDLKA